MTWVLKNESEFARREKREALSQQRKHPQSVEQEKAHPQIPVDSSPPNGVCQVHL